MSELPPNDAAGSATRFAAKSLLVVCGFNREASLASGEAVETLAGGGNRAALERRLVALDPTGYAGVLSFGFVGALSPSLDIGDVAIPSGCVGDAGPIPVTLSIILRACTAGSARAGPTLVGVDAPAMTRAGKAELARRTGAQLVDMESHVAGPWAARHGLPFGILRVVSDGSERDLPPLVAVSMRPDGGVDLPAILLSLVRNPGQMPGLVRTARDFRAASRVLRRVGGLLGGSRRLLGGDGRLLGLDLR